MTPTVRMRLTVVLAVTLVVLATVFAWRAQEELPSAAGPAPRAVEPEETQPPEEPTEPAEAEDPRYTALRRQMVEQQFMARDIVDPRVLDAMGRVPRQRFVPAESRAAAYEDHPLPIGYGQTISQPYIVALMTQLAQPAANAKVLDVGTGSGYQAAVLGELAAEVYSIEILCPLADSARDRLASLGYDNVEVRCGDGYAGWPEHAPFDAIIVAAAPDHIPQPLQDQLAPGGRLVIPVGGMFQNLLVIEKQPDGSLVKRLVAPVAFVPMTRQRQEEPQDREPPP